MRAYQILLESQAGVKSIDISAVQDEDQALKLARKKYSFAEWRVIQLNEKR